MDWIDYREKLGVGFCDKEKEKIFYTRISNVLSGLVAEGTVGVSANEYFEFCNETGSSMDHALMAEYRGNDRFHDCVRIIREHEKYFPSYLSFIVWFINCVDDDNPFRRWNKVDYKKLLLRCLADTHIPYDLLEEDNRIFVFPKGAEELDTALVSQPLSWLSAYPGSHAAFVKALKQYSEVTAETASDVADLFRKALETFFQEFFSSEKTLENCKGLYGGYLKSQNVPAEISANLETLLQAYTNFMNGHAKHHNKTSLNVLEYIMYQTGNIIRLLVTLKHEEEKQ